MSENNWDKKSKLISLHETELLLHVSAAQQKSEAKNKVTHKINYSDKGSHRVLVIDDDDEVRRVITRTILWLGFIADEASTPVKALEMVEKRFYDVIFLDVILPTMNGLQLYKKIRYKSPLSNVYFMTAFSVDEIIREGLLLGAKAYIPKPFDLDTIIKIVRTETE
ncbi:MAG: response regulator [Elusimicrobiota bacterium]